MVEPLSAEDFDACITDALEALPDDILAAIDNCIIVVEDEPPADAPDLLGLYEGIPLTERDSTYAGVLPDRIFLFQGPLQRMCADRDELVDEIGVTVWHEIAHHFGIDDARLHELGYD